VSAFEVLGLACFDEKFRNDLFNNFAVAIAPFDALTWAERDALLAISRNQKVMEAAMVALGTATLMVVGCPNPPDCPWPDAYKLNKPVKSGTGTGC
jgi:hypothetical protein